MPKAIKKALKLSADVDVHAVSCPGVWLPGKGRCSLSICLLGFHTRTNFLPPSFPMLFHEKFKFDRTFVGVRSLSALETVLERETVYFELVQEDVTGDTVLAVFESSVRDLLFPTAVHTLSYSGMDLDLLMEPTRDFPGILSPKIEIGTRSSVRETRAPLHECETDNVSFGHAGDNLTKAVYKPLGPTRKLKDDTIRQHTNKCADGKEEPAESGGSESPSPKLSFLNSRHRSRSTGNLTEVGRGSLNSRFGRPRSAGSGISRLRKDDLCHDALISPMDPDKCPHCDCAPHSLASCSTCRLYNTYFPPNRVPAGYSHRYARVLRQPPCASTRSRRRKRYLVDDTTWKSRQESAPLRPSSAPPGPCEATGSSDEREENSQGPSKLLMDGHDDEDILDRTREHNADYKNGKVPDHSMEPRGSGRIERRPVLDYRLRRNYKYIDYPHDECYFCNTPFHSLCRYPYCECDYPYDWCYRPYYSSRLLSSSALPLRYLRSYNTCNY